MHSQGSEMKKKQGDKQGWQRNNFQGMVRFVGLTIEIYLPIWS